MGFGPGAIPLSEIESYFRIFGVDDPFEREDFIEVIGAMDGVYLKWADEDTQTQTKPQPQPPQPK